MIVYNRYWMDSVMNDVVLKIQAYDHNLSFYYDDVDMLYHNKLFDDYDIIPLSEKKIVYTFANGDDDGHYYSYNDQLHVVDTRHYYFLEVLIYSTN